MYRWVLLANNWTSLTVVTEEAEANGEQPVEVEEDDVKVEEQDSQEEFTVVDSTHEG